MGSGKNLLAEGSTVVRVLGRARAHNSMEGRQGERGDRLVLPLKCVGVYPNGKTDKKNSGHTELGQ